MLGGQVQEEAGAGMHGPSVQQFWEGSWFCVLFFGDGFLNKGSREVL